VVSLAELHIGLLLAKDPMDLLIAATAKALHVPLISLDEDLNPLADVIDLHRDPGKRADPGTPS